MICHNTKCIFIHIPKNAGQSIEHVFLKLQDLTWETRAPLLLRSNDNPKIGPPRLAHLKANEYVINKYLSEELFNDYFKFAFVRNPWSRMVSMYKYLGFDYKSDFKKFVKRDFKNKIFHEKNWFVGQQSKYVMNNDGEQMVDFIGKFESFQEDFYKVCEKINLPNIEVPHINAAKDRERNSVLKVNNINLARNTLRKIKGISNFPTYQEYYDQESIDIIADLYKEDIELFNYKFD